LRQKECDKMRNTRGYMWVCARVRARSFPYCLRAFLSQSVKSRGASAMRPPVRHHGLLFLFDLAAGSLALEEEGSGNIR
jgi:hypothetical protein